MFKRVPRLRDEHWERMHTPYTKYGAGLLFFSFIPGLGLGLEAVAGAAGVRLVVYILWVFLGRLFLYVLLVLVATGGLELFGQ